MIDNNAQDGVQLLQAGIDSNEPGTSEGKFYFHLGDGYCRLNQTEKVIFHGTYSQTNSWSLYLGQHKILVHIIYAQILASIKECSILHRLCSAKLFEAIVK